MMFKAVSFIEKRFNFLRKQLFSQYKNKSFCMINDPFGSWVAPEKKNDSFLTGLQVNNSLSPHKLVNTNIIL